MRCNPPFFKALLATVLSCAAMSSYADITKCVGRDGQISYSSEGAGGCNESDTVSVLATARPDQPTAAAAPRVVSRQALENTVIRESAWAQAPAAMHRARTDAATVEEARINLLAIDRALASMRTQKVASSQ